MAENKYTGPTWSGELMLMMRIFLALFWKRIDIRPLIDADHLLELSRNSQLAAAPPDAHEEHRRNYATTLALRISILRRILFHSFIVIASAVVLALVLSKATSADLPSVLRVVFGTLSIFCLAWATLARLGWSGQSYKGDTVVERFDERLFWALYWLGTFTGTLALV
jgi:hypothetical protein